MKAPASPAPTAPPTETEIDDAIVDPGYSGHTRKTEVKSAIAGAVAKTSRHSDGVDAKIRDDAKRSVRAHQDGAPKSDDAV